MDDQTANRRPNRFAQGLERRRTLGLGQQAADVARSFWGAGGSGKLTTVGGGARPSAGYYQAPVAAAPRTPVTSAGTPAPAPGPGASSSTPAAPKPAPAPTTPSEPAPQAPAATNRPPQPQFPGDPGRTGDMAFAQPPPAPAPDPGTTGDSFFTTPAATGATRAQTPVATPPDFQPQVAPRGETATVAPPNVGGFLAANRRRGF